MNKRRVDDWILKAKTALEVTEIANNGKVPGGFRGQISAFGAAMVMGSFRSAVAFYTENGDAAVKRQKLLQAVYYVICDDKDLSLKDERMSPQNIFKYVCENDTKELKESFIDASIAVKLAMNFFDLD